MKEEGKAVDAQWSLEEEPSVCENCEFYDEGRCYKEKKD